MFNQITKINSAVGLLTPRLATAIEKIPEIESERIQDIRLRQGRYLSVTIFDKEYFVTEDGVLQNNPNKAVKVFKEDQELVFKKAFQNSIHSFSREISQGYITIIGGNRVGFCGTAVVNTSGENEINSIKNVSSINIRIAREIYGCANELFKSVYSDGDKSLLILGPPCSGKTTILRDLCRQLGNVKSVCVVDERNEISATIDGLVQNKIGNMTDIFCSYSKYNGIMTAVKVMSPKILICDEIGSKDDSKALEYAVNSGVKLVATAHSPDFEDAKKRITISKLIKDKVFDYIAVLGTGAMCGKIINLIKYNS
ncbi:MAG: stage III sporulation protein AA [Clostridiales bacterium]|nr:stage III sporulation protein AA [Clostridiales bacterium]